MRPTTPFALSLLALIAIAAPARAEIGRTVPTGSTQQIDFFASLHPDCSPTGTPVVRLVEGPSKGMVTTERGRDFMAFPRGNPRSRCNARRVAGTRLFYRSADNFFGVDHVRLLILSGSGQGREATYSIEVR